MTQLFDNDRYIVRQKEDNSGYEVVSKVRGVVEFTGTSYPRAIVVASEYDSWEKRFEESQKEEATGSGNVVPFAPRGD